MNVDEFEKKMCRSNSVLQQSDGKQSALQRTQKKPHRYDGSTHHNVKVLDASIGRDTAVIAVIK